MVFFCKSKVSTAVLALLATSTFSIQAQQSEQPDNNSKVLDEVVSVGTPIRDSQKAAIEAKRSASNVMEVIAADTIGRFPDQNLADSLGRGRVWLLSVIRDRRAILTSVACPFGIPLSVLTALKYRAPKAGVHRVLTLSPR